MTFGQFRTMFLLFAIFWATVLKIGLLLIQSSGHTDGDWADFYTVGHLFIDANWTKYNQKAFFILGRL